MLELVIAELKADDYRSRMPDVAARKRIEKKYFELIGEKISWDPEITSKIGYLCKLWNIHSQLVKRTGVAVDPSSGQIDMVETWWSDRIAEYGGTKGRLVHVLQKKPLPFKDLLDQIFGEHDVDQDERYSPHMLGLQLQQVQPTLDVDGITMVDQLQETQTAEPIVDLTSDQGCNRSIRSTSSRRLARRKTSFETQVESGFQRVVDTRQEFLEELRSRKIQKITYGDATSVLEKLPIEQLGVFWWAANKLLKNDADIREAFVKLENEEIKIKYMESLLGTDRHGSPCNQVDLLTTSQNHFQSVGMGGSTAIGANTGGGYMSFLGVHSTELEEPRREPTSFVSLLNESNDDGLV
uniref:Myb/SANT-like domain-containing protein n=1 Tax=Brassica campestris TaxID=3711 RepID=M4E1K2_BRACM